MKAAHGSIREMHWHWRGRRGSFRAMTNPAQKRQAFRKLHETGCFVIPNPWSPGTARYLEGLGFKALASTSSGYAHSQGFADGALTLNQVLTHYSEITAATSIPVNADFENGFADDPAQDHER